VEERIRRVENGLLPPAVLKGEAPQLMKLEDRMRFHRTPGLSVAVINNGQIEWSRSYGFVEPGGTKRVSVETMFQAADNLSRSCFPKRPIHFF
jgi:CubicO group peptidase (beta-lactamase class C family)